MKTKVTKCIPWRCFISNGCICWYIQLSGAMEVEGFKLEGKIMENGKHTNSKVWCLGLWHIPRMGMLQLHIYSRLIWYSVFNLHSQFPLFLLGDEDNFFLLVQEQQTQDIVLELKSARNVWSFKPDLKAFFRLLCLVMLVTTRGESYRRHQRSQNDFSVYNWEQSKLDCHLKSFTPDFFYLLQSHLL